jgi:hypothetical protein
MDDSNRFVGCVVDPQHNHVHLDLHDQAYFDQHAEDGNLHICLVLGIWEDYSQSPATSIFYHNSLKPFPWYRVCKVEHAEVIEIDKIVDYVDYMKNWPNFPGLNWGSLVPRIFGLTRKQIETLQTCQCVNHYISGGSFNSEGMPKNLIDSQAEKLYAELAQAIPR